MQFSKHFFYAIFFLVSAFASHQLWAGNWELIYTQHINNGDVATFIDRTTIHKTGKLRKVWLVRNYSYVLFMKDIRSAKFISYRSVKTLSYFDCERKEEATVKELLFSDEMAKGMIVHTTVFATDVRKLRWNKPAIWKYVSKETASVCSS